MNKEKIKVADKEGPKWFDFDSVEVPYDLGTAEYMPSEEMWNRYRTLMEDSEVFITNAMRPRAVLTYRILPPPPGEQHINAGHDAEYFANPIPGKKLIIKSKIADKYIKREKPYLITETEVTDEDGRLIERFRRTSMVKSPLLGKKWWGNTRKTYEVGSQLEPVTKSFTLKMMHEFEFLYGMASADGEVENFHVDDEAAKTAGLKKPIASAHMTISYMHDLMNKNFGHNWTQGGKLALKFIYPIVDGDTVTYQGKVIGKESEGEKTRLKLEVWAENQNGKQTAVGTASVVA
jgi:hypothetical protein